MRLIPLMVLLLCGCAAPQAGRVVLGAPVDAPQGYVELCARQPQAPECGGR